MYARRLAPLLATAFLGAGCEFDKERPSFRVLTPEDGAINDSSSLLVQIAVEDFTLDPVAFDPNEDDDSEPYHGHWHLFVTPRGEDGRPDYELTVGYDILGGSDSALLTGLEAGEPEIAVELVNQNHSHIQGVPFEFIDIVVPADAPSLSIEEPDDLDDVSSSVELSLVAGNFTLDSNLGGANATDHGHYHVFLGAPDGVPEAEGFTPSILLTDIVPIQEGAFALEIYVELVANDHSTLSTPVLDAVFVEIPSSQPRMAIASPAPDATVGTALTLNLDLAGDFQLVDFTTVVANSDGQGHYHVLVDGVDVGHDFTDPSGPFVLPPGPHEVRVELRANDHDALSPPVVDVVNVTAE